MLEMGWFGEAEAESAPLLCAGHKAKGWEREKKRGRIRWMERAVSASLSWTVKRAASQAGMRAARHGELSRQCKQRGKGADRNHFQQARGPQKSQTKANPKGGSTDGTALEDQPAEPGLNQLWRGGCPPRASSEWGHHRRPALGCPLQAVAKVSHYRGVLPASCTHQPHTFG